MTTQTKVLPTNTEVVSALRARRERIFETWTSASGGLAAGVVVVPSGVPIPVPGTDNVHRFRAHDDFVWLSGGALPACVLVCDPQRDSGEAAFELFAHQAGTEDRVWHGDGVSLDDLAGQTGLARVRPLDELEAYLASLGARSVGLFGSTDVLDHPLAYGLAPSMLEALSLDAELSARLEQGVHAARRVKDDVELAFMRAAARATCAGHRDAMARAVPGMSELELRIELEAAFLRAGADEIAYGSIVASGPNAAVLHASPTRRRFAAEELLLIDAGAEVAKYDCDVTRTFPVGGRFSSERRAIYDIVFDVQRRAIDGARAGAEYRELHLEACRGIAAGLLDFGVLKGDPDDLVERDVHALFFPHGLGHLIGLSTHDVAGYLDGRERSERPGLEFLRADLPLEAGFVVTIEPGVYFIEALLLDAVLRAEHADAVDWRRAEAMLPIGGVRIEDTVHVTSGDPEVLTAAAPTSPDEIEALSAS